MTPKRGSKGHLALGSLGNYIVEFGVDQTHQLKEMLNNKIQLPSEQVWSMVTPSTCVVMSKHAVIGPHVPPLPCDEKILVHSGRVVVVIWGDHLAVRQWQSKPLDFLPYDDPSKWECCSAIVPVPSGSQAYGNVLPAPTAVFKVTQNEVINLTAGCCCEVIALEDTGKFISKEPLFTTCTDIYC